MNRRYEIFLLTTLPVAVITVLIMNAFGWGESGFAAAVIGIPLMLVSMWIIDPFELGWHDRAPEDRRAS